MTMASIRKFLDLSTNHLPQVVCDQLDDYAGIEAYPTSHGWWMWVPDDVEGSAAVLDDAPIPDVLLDIQRYARSYGCDWVLFDADGDLVDELPSWNW